MTTLSHLDAAGHASMVDVGDKRESVRLAVAAVCVRMHRETLAMIQDEGMPKGDVLAVARIAGIQAAKRCDELIPLCHSLPLDAVAVTFHPLPELPGIEIQASARVTARTGVEMEAMTAASVAALTVYDMCKAVDRGMMIDQLRLLRKEGGRSGVWQREDEPSGSAGRSSGESDAAGNGEVRR